MSKSLIQKIALSSALGLSTLAGCRAKVYVQPQPLLERPVPYYRTNTLSTGGESFGDKDFDSGIHGINYDLAGKRVHRKGLTAEDILYLEGNRAVDASKLLKTPDGNILLGLLYHEDQEKSEVALELDRQAGLMESQPPVNKIRVYEKVNKGGIVTNIPYKTRTEEKGEGGSFFIREPKFKLPINIIDGMPVAHATVLVDNREVLGLVPYPNNPVLYKGFVRVKGDTYIERIATIRPESMERLYEKDTIVRGIKGKLIFDDISTTAPSE